MRTRAASLFMSGHLFFFTGVGFSLVGSSPLGELINKKEKRSLVWPKSIILNVSPRFLPFSDKSGLDPPEPHMPDICRMWLVECNLTIVSSQVQNEKNDQRWKRSEMSKDVYLSSYFVSDMLDKSIKSCVINLTTNLSLIVGYLWPFSLLNLPWMGARETFSE